MEIVTERKSRYRKYPRRLSDLELWTKVDAIDIEIKGDCVVIGYVRNNQTVFEYETDVIVGDNMVRIHNLELYVRAKER